MAEWVNVRGKEFYAVTSHGTVANMLTAMGSDAIGYIPPQTFSEAITISDANVTLLGTGKSSLIDGGTTGTAITISAADVSLLNLAFNTTAGEANAYRGVFGTGARTIIDGCYLLEADSYGIRLDEGSDYAKVSFRCEDTVDFAAAIMYGQYDIFKDCIIDYTPGTGGISLQIASPGDNCLFINNVCHNSGTSGWGIYMNGTTLHNLAFGNFCNTDGGTPNADINVLSDDSLAVGNVVNGSVNDGGSSNTVASNEVF